MTNLPDTTLVKKALLENINLRTNWIKTVEKLLGDLSLTDTLDETYKFKVKTRETMEKRFSEYWKRSVNEDTARLLFYKSIKNEHGQMHRPGYRISKMHLMFKKFNLLEILTIGPVCQ